MGDAHKYGQCRWGVIVKGVKAIHYVFADSCRVTEAGVLVLESADREVPTKTHVRYAYAPGLWQEVFAASVLDGSAVAVD